MSNGRLSLSLAFLLLVLLATPGIAVPPQQVPSRDQARPSVAGGGTASIAGRVVIANAVPAQVIRRARVSLEGGALAEPQVMDSDTDGRFRFAGVAAGTYRLSASKPGFVTPDSARAVQVEVKDGDTGAATIALPRGAALEGRIVNESGDPVENVAVTAVRLAYHPAGYRPTTVRQARTNDLGRFRIHSLPPGDYYLQAASDARTAVNAAAYAGRRSGYAPTYFPGTPRASEARRVSVATGQEATNLDFTIAAVPVVQASVSVLDASGSRPSGLPGCRLQPVGAARSVPGFSDPNGDRPTIFPSVPPGEYWLLAAAVPAGGDPQYAATRVTIGGDNAVLTARTQPGARLDGRIELEGSAPLPSLGGLEVVAYEAEYELPSVRGAAAPNAPIPVGADGRFAFLSLFGPRVIRVTRLPAGWTVLSVHVADKEITDAVTDFQGGDAKRVLRVVLTNRTASVTGTVTGARAGAAEGPRVVVFAQDQRRWGPWSRFVKSVVASDKGAFALDGLLPGRYLICAVDNMDPEAWNDPALLERLRAVALPLTLGEGDKQSVAIRARDLS